MQALKLFFQIPKYNAPPSETRLEVSLVVGLVHENMSYNARLLNCIHFGPDVVKIFTIKQDGTVLLAHHVDRNLKL